MIDLLEIPAVLPPAELASVLTVLRSAPAEDSTVHGVAAEAVRPLMRKSSRLVPPADVEALLVARLEACRAALEAHFGQPLGRLEPLQILHYRPGDYFVAHQDGNTPLIRDSSRHRRVSISLLLSAPEDYRGGELVFHGSGRDLGQRRAVGVPAGGLVAFRSETTHEVLPLESGERYSVAAWLLSPDAG